MIALMHELAGNMTILLSAPFGFYAQSLVG
jgi:hypothetical protein